MRAWNRNQTIDALDIPLCNLCYIRCPLLPIALFPHLLNHTCIDGISQLFYLRYRQEKLLRVLFTAIGSTATAIGSTATAIGSTATAIGSTTTATGSTPPPYQ